MQHEIEALYRRQVKFCQDRGIDKTCADGQLSKLIEEMLEFRAEYRKDPHAVGEAVQLELADVFISAMSLIYSSGLVARFDEKRNFWIASICDLLDYALMGDDDGIHVDMIEIFHDLRDRIGLDPDEFAAVIDKKMTINESRAGRMIDGIWVKY